VVLGWWRQMANHLKNKGKKENPIKAGLMARKIEVIY
jgi:hypothetical protein